MDKYQKLLEYILLKRSDSNISFSDLCKLLKKLGFNERIRGDHHIFTKDNILEIINIQPKGKNAKPYQIKQIRNIILNYGLQLGELNDK